MWKKYLATLLLCLCSTFAQASDSAEGSVKAPAPSNLDELAQALERELAAAEIPGAQLSLFNADGVYWSMNYGTRGGEQAVTDATRFRAGSTTKTLVALAIMQLVQQGRFSLNDEVQLLEPGLKIENPWRESHPVRVIHLLEHTAGFDDMHFRNIYNLDQPNISLLDAVNRDRASLRVRWPAGTRHSYSNPGYGILGVLIEKYSGQSFEDYVQEQVLQPLGMQQSQLLRGLNEPEDLSQGFKSDEATPYYQIYLRSAGNLITSANDLGRLGSLLLSSAQTANLPGIDARIIHQMEAPQSTLAARAGLGYGYASGIYHITRNNREWLAHHGGIDGFLAVYAYSREAGQGYSLMINTSTSRMRGVEDLLATYLTRELAPIETKEEYGVPESIAGYYRAANDRNEILIGLTYPLSVVNIRPSSVGLIMKPLIGATTTYQHLGKQQYAEQFQAHARMIVVEQAPEGTVIDVDRSYLVKISALQAWFPVVVLAIIVLGLIFSLLYLPVWLINMLRGKLKDGRRLQLRLYPFLSIACLLVVVVALFNLSLPHLAVPNWQTFTVRYGTLTFAALSLFSVYYVTRYRSDEPNLWARGMIYLNVLSCVVLSLYLYTFNYLGLALWRW